MTGTASRSGARLVKAGLVCLASAALAWPLEVTPDSRVIILVLAPIALGTIGVIATMVGGVLHFGGKQLESEMHEFLAAETPLPRSQKWSLFFSYLGVALLLAGFVGCLTGCVGLMVNPSLAAAVLLGGGLASLTCSFPLLKAARQAIESAT